METQYGPTGGPISYTYALVDKDGNVVDQETLRGTAVIRIKNVMNGSSWKSQQIILKGVTTLTTIYENGKTKSMTTVGEGSLAGKLNNATLYSYPALDAQGNFTKRIVGKEGISFGEKKVVPSEITYQTVEYY